jgi:Heterokaryon incompatibility protein (HET)
MSTSDSVQSASNNNDRKRRRKQQPRTAKKPRLDEGTSHPLQVQKHIQKLRIALLGDLEIPTTTYVYTPLKESHGEDIRVLVIEPGKGDDPIKCKLVPSALSNANPSSKTKAYPYTALSYFWGEGKPIHEITITSYRAPKKRLKKLSDKDAKNRNTVSLWQKGKPWCESGKLPVRSNLYVALQRFRKKDRDTIMWVDALCIDQEDGTERSKQVEKMHELYIHAKNVRIWLGDGSSEEAPNPETCFQFLRKFLDLKNLDSLLEDLANDRSDLVENAANLVSLMCNKWFSRRWVLQELALARKAEVVYGREKMLWSDFADAIAIFIKCQERIRPVLSKMLSETALSVSELSPVEVIKNLGANALVDFANNLFRRSENGDIQQRMMTLEVLVSNLLAFEATDPRDTIYAVLSLAKDIHRFSTETNEDIRYLDLDPRLSPNYKKKSLLDVYTDFIAYCIDESQSLDILLRHWAPLGRKETPKRIFSKGIINKDQKEAELPTWIPLIHKSSHGTPSQRVRGRSNGDSFVGTSFVPVTETTAQHWTSTQK